MKIDLAAHAMHVAEELGRPVFPVLVRSDPKHLGKTIKQPLVKGWSNGAAVTNAQGIEELFSLHPDATHVGIQTGQGLLVVDLDGSAALQWWAEHLKLLPLTRTVWTRREDGRHLYYKLPPRVELRNSTGRIAVGIDTRGDGGFVVDWTSETGPANGDLADAPQALINLLQADGRKPQPAQPRDNSEGIPEGRRNAELARIAGQVRRTGWNVSRIEATLQAINVSECTPPLDREEVSRIASSVSRYEPVADSTPVAVRQALDWAALQDQEPPPREWVLPHWIPVSHVALLAGRAGIGKTLLAQHFATAVATARPFVEPPTHQRVLMWAGEDDHGELWRRQRNICSWMGEPLSALSDKLFLHSYAGADITLAGTAYGQLSPTAMLDELRQQVHDYQAGFVILDNIARLFGGNENNRHEVTTFIAWVQGACQPATVLLLGHPAKAQGSEFSGSTAWEGAVRARLYLSDRPPDAKVGEDEASTDDRVRYLARRKANYSPLELRRLTLEDGVLIPEAVEPGRVRQPTGEFAADIVRRAIRGLKDMGFHGNASTRSPDYLPKLAGNYGLLDTLSEKRFGAAMRELIKAGELINQPVGHYSNRSAKMGLLLK